MLLNHKILIPPPRQPVAVSVVIPMYNAEEYICECLDSLLIQTFQNFEVIVADDCSTDNSVKVVENYIPKFGGRLGIIRTEKNSGGGGYIPRNIGLSQASGEYVIFLDSDDFLLGSALEILYNTAKIYGADVVYSSVYYDVIKPNSVRPHRDGLGSKLFKAGIKDKTEFTIDDRDKIFQEFITPGSGEGNFRHPWSKFVRRDYLIENEILFPDIVTGGDCIWCISVYAHAKKFLRLPIPLYFYRRYNGSSITRVVREPSEQVAYWIAALSAFIKALSDLTNKTEFLRKHPYYCYEATRGGHFKWCLNRTDEAREKLSNKEVYEALYREFSKRDDLSDFTMPFLFSTIDADRKEHKADLQTISELKKEVEQFKKSSMLPRASSLPIISVIIPVYNAEKYIGECIESILDQTFQDFEIIVVDDCSTDSSFKVVESYIPKSKGRLKLLSMGKNSGSAPAPRNKGLGFSRGEYIFFMDSDDTFTKTALEEMYTLAKKYDADVVYCEKYYMSTGVGEEFIKNTRLANNLIQSGDFVDKPTLISNDLSERLEELLEKRFWVTPWQRLVSRKILAEYKITFPEIIGCDDAVWCFQVLFAAKNFLRVPNACYIRRMYDESFTKSSKKSPNRHLHQWMDVAVRGLKFADKFMDRVEFFRENTARRYKAFTSIARSSFNVTYSTYSKLQPEELYDIFLKEFSKDTGENNVLVSFLCTIICEQNKTLRKGNPQYDKLIKEKDSEINRLREELDLVSYQQSLEQVIPAAPLPFRPITCPVSVIVSLYNYEKYIGECLDSLLNQSFHDFEVIVVDDCSTDNSVEVVKSYMPKFNGRLKLIQMEQNSGGGGIPRNKGLENAGGEYVFFMDADDVFTPTALEEMYTLAKEYGADVVYCEKYYMSKGIGQEFKDNIRIAEERSQRPPFIDKPTLETEDFVERTARAIKLNYWPTPWLRLVQRRLLIENNVRFDSLIASNDVNWTFKVLFCSKRFLRVPNVCYIRRIHDESVSFRKRTPVGFIHKWMDRSVRSLKDMDNFLSNIKFFADNPKYRSDILNYFLTSDLQNSFKECNSFSRFDMYNAFRNSFGKYFGDHDILLACLYARVYSQGKWWDEKYKKLEKENQAHIAEAVPREFIPYMTARMDIKIIPGTGEFQILSVSDKNADISKPAWMQKSSIGYQIQSHAGQLEFTAKATADGQIQLSLMGMYVSDPKNKSKRIPYWIDYTKLTINGKTLFNTPTPVWHDKPYSCKMNVKAGEEIKVQAKWCPHRSDAKTVEALTAQPLPKKDALTEEKISAVEKKYDEEIKKLLKRTTELENYNAHCRQILNKVAPYMTARIDIKMMSGTGEFQIYSISDKNADISKPAWLQQDGIGYKIQSYVGQLKFVAKATVNGQIQFLLRGVDIRDPKEKSKRLPYRIDYTKLTINGKTIFNTLTPAWHDEPYIYKMNAKSGEEITIQVEWLPHKSDT